LAALATCSKLLRVQRLAFLMGHTQVRERRQSIRHKTLRTNCSFQRGSDDALSQSFLEGLQFKPVDAAGLNLREKLPAQLL